MGIEIYFTGELKKGIEGLIRSGGIKRAEELRLRVNRPVRVGSGGKMYYLTKEGTLREDTKTVQDDLICRREELERSLELMSGYSFYAFGEELRNGFITLPGGHRIGICGQAVCEKGQINHIKNIGSVNFRLAREHIGVAKELVGRLLLPEGGLYDTLILSPAGCGKTTLLRDIVRIVSDMAITVCVIDERSEIAACYKGIPQNDVGACTDVMDMTPKAEGIMMALRAMSPRVIAVDEINHAEDMQAVRSAKSCGAALLCTMHSNGINFAEQNIAEEGLFERYIRIGYSRAVRTDGGRKQERSCRIYDKTGKILYEGKV